MIREANVLLVEDDPSDYRLIQRAFNKLGQDFHMFRLVDGEEALSYMSGDRPFDNRALHPMPQVVLLDIKLPRRSGFEVLQWLRRQDSPLRRIPVVMLTSSRHGADVNRAYDLGANSYLVKPDTNMQLEELASRFKEYWLSLNETPDLHAGPSILR
jgi:CheY-like chemotaxis protein